MMYTTCVNLEVHRKDKFCIFPNRGVIPTSSGGLSSLSQFVTRFPLAAKGAPTSLLDAEFSPFKMSCVKPHEDPRDGIDIGSESKEVLLSRAQHVVGQLKVMTQECILLNIRLFLALAMRYPDVNPFNIISKEMRKELIELHPKMYSGNATAAYNFEAQIETLLLLLNDKITVFHFPLELVRNENQAASMRMCEALLDVRPSDLHTVVAISRCTYAEDNWNTSLLADRLVNVFVNIEVLRIDGCVWGDEQLSNAAEHLPKLRTLEVYLSADPNRLTTNGFQALASLSLLREFSFYKTPWLCLERLTELLLMCFQFLPHLHSHVIDPLPNTSCNYLMENLGKATKSALNQITHVLILDLRRLVVKGSLYRSAVSFPKLSELFLFDSFANITSNLSILGQRLTALTFDCPRYRVQVESVLAQCPNLTKLCWNGNEVTQLQAQLQPNWLQQLRELQIYRFDVNAHNMDPIAKIVQLAPQLRTLNLHLDECTSFELNKILKLAKRPTCLRHLEEFKLVVEAFSICNKTTFQSEIQNFVLDCEELKIFKLDFLVMYL